jgi:uncharacterized phage protein (TIGR01671 family)
MKMREIKFRAWEKNLKEIIPVHNINFVNRMVNTESAWRLFDEIKLSQYTGLKDKNGNEIYEGDILNLFMGEDDYCGQVIVTFDDGCFCINGYLDDPRTYPIRHFIFRGYTFEVIGNIYETELLEAAE